MPAFKFCPQCASPLTIDNKTETRNTCSQQCGFTHYDNPTPVVAIVVEYQAKVVLARNRDWPKPFYGIITGFVDRGEAPEQAVLRELKEELNLSADKATLISIHTSPEMNQVYIGYHVKAEGDIVLNEELDDFKLVPPNECFIWPSGTGYVLRDWLQTIGVEPTLLSFASDE